MKMSELRRSGLSYYHEIISTFDDKATMLPMNLQLTKQMSILIYLPVPIRKNEGTPPRKPYSLLRLLIRNAVYMNRENKIEWS